MNKKLTLAVLLVFLMPISWQVSAQTNEITFDEITIGLLWAALGGSDIDEINRLIQKGADVTAVIFLLFENNMRLNDDILRILVEHTADINAADNHGRTILMHTVTNNFSGYSYNALQILLENGADVNAADNAGITALMRTVRSYDFTRALIENGADINAVDNYGRTPLLFAFRTLIPDWLNLDVLRLLIDKGADVNAADKDGWTPLLLAARNNFRPDVLQILIENGANVNAANHDGQAGLMLAAAYERVHWSASNAYRRVLEFMQILLEYGADPDMKDNEGRRAIDYAEQNEELIAYFTRSMMIASEADFPWHRLLSRPRDRN